MRDLQQALAEIDAIRGQIARGTEFRGYGPWSAATAGVLALLVAAWQCYEHVSAEQNMHAFLGLWVAVAAVAVTLTGIETVKRARRAHSGFANEMINHAVEQFVPALVAGALLAGVLMEFSPQNLWMLPGLWQIVFSLGVFASCRFLPRQMFLVGLWYLGAGLTCLVLCASGGISPWSMGIPFGVGQLLVALVLLFGLRGRR